MMQLSKLLARFSSNNRGAIAVIFALLAFPAVIFVVIAVDYARANRSQSIVQGAVDSAAFTIAAMHASNRYIPPQDPSADDPQLITFKRKAQQHVTGSIARIRGAVLHELNVSVSNNSVTVETLHSIPATLQLSFSKRLEVSTQSKVLLDGNPTAICLLVLDPNASGALTVSGTAKVSSPDCAAQVNSSHTTAARTIGNAVGEIKTTCVVGGYSGSGVSPEPKQCPNINDPYAGKFDKTALKFTGSCDHTDQEVKKGEHTFSDNGAGVRFCGDTKFATGSTVTFGPGVYVFFGKLDLRSGATVIADEGTTFVFVSDGAFETGHLNVQANANLKLVAPKSGPLAGMAIIHYSKVKPSNLVHKIIGGGSVDIVGVIYTPDAEIKITGGGAMNANSDFFGIIANTVNISGNGVLNLKNDHAAQGYPADILPSLPATKLRLVD